MPKMTDNKIHRTMNGLTEAAAQYLLMIDKNKCYADELDGRILRSAYRTACIKRLRTGQIVLTALGKKVVAELR